MSFPALYPESDHEEFISLKPEVRARAWRLYDAARIVSEAGRKNRVATCKAIAAETKSSWKSIYEPVRAFLASPDWRVFIDRRHHSELWHRDSFSGRPHEFDEFWRGLVESNQRAAKPAYELLLRRLAAWRAGDMSCAIPGYPFPPPNMPGKRHPAKWSYRDLMRVQPSQIELAANRAGRAEAMKKLPAVLTTRKGGYPLQEIQFDDMFHDITVVHGTQLVRVLEFGAIDWFSVYHFPPVLKPRINLDGVNKSLSEREFRCFAVHFARTIGWSPRGTIYRGERGLCAFRSGLAEKLERWSHGGIRIAEPGISGAPALTGGFSEVAKGNPNAKALKESRGKIIHNYLAALPGQTGMNPANMPASAAGRNAETLALLELQAATGRNLTLAHKTFEDAARLVFAVNDIINSGTDHNHEGWEECGLITQELCVDPDRGLWLPVTAENQALYSIIAATAPEKFRVRRMSAMEVIRPHLEKTTRLTQAAAFDCIYDDCKRRETVEGGRIAFQDASYGIGTFRYPATYQDRSGFQKTLPNGEQVHLVVNPFDLENAGIFTPDGKYLGRVRRHHAPTRADEEAIHREIGRKAALFKDATLATSVRQGLKRANAMTDNAAILIDSIRADVLREHGLAPAPTAAETPRVPISELLSDPEDHSDFSDPSEPEPQPTRTDPLAILLGH